MKRTAFCLALVSLLALGGGAVAEVGTIDDVPAATLLLPYFECELDANLVPVVGGLTTLFSINNASGVAALAHVTLWTDESIPTLDFDVYLTGYDVQTINVCDIFNGNLPRTADDGLDPTDTISPDGGKTANQDLSFPGSTGPCGSPYINPALGTTFLTHLRNAHTGGPSTIFGNRCAGFNYGDNVARGYITVDESQQCNLDFPSTPGYFTGFAGFRNILWGDYFYVNSAQNFAQGETLVHIEACNTDPRLPTPPNPPYVGYVGTGTSGVNTCLFGAGDYTFYGRYVSGLGTDQREALTTTFATRYLNGGIFDGGTKLYVWRDAKTLLGVPGAANGAHSCSSNVSWFPLNQADVVAFDEEEDCTDLCFRGDNVSPPVGGADTCFPLETQCVNLAGGNISGDDPTPPYDFGWMYLNLNTTTSGLFNPTAQAWITTVMDAEGRFSVGFDAISLDQANQTFQSASPGGVILVP